MKTSPEASRGGRGSSSAILGDDAGAPGLALAFTWSDVDRGLYQIDAIPAGTYWLTKLSAPEGSGLLVEPLRYTVEDDRTVTVSDDDGVVTASGRLITVRDVPARVVPAGGVAIASLVRTRTTRYASDPGPTHHEEDQ